MPPETPLDPARFVRPGRCTTTIQLTAAELVQCADVTNPMFMPQETLRCELPDGHPGAHLALAQAWHDATPEPVYELWMHWAPGGRNLVILDPCPRRDDSGDAAQEPCTLPAGHVGPHTFDWATTA